MAGGFKRSSSRHSVAWHFPGLAFWLAVLLCLLVLIPVAWLALNLPYPAAEGWEQLRPQLPTLFSNSLYLVAGVVFGSGLLGIGLAWLTTLCEFPGRRFFSWALALPIAIPAYVMGFVVLGVFGSDGLARGAWQAWQGEDADLSLIHSTDGLILTLSLSLYPYVYLPARHAFRTRGGQAIEAARGLGAKPYAAFFRAALPVAWPWIGAGLAWVAMETLADFGTVSLFHYETFTTAIYREWAVTPASPAAAQLASILMLLAFAALVLEFYQRKRQPHYHPARCSGGFAPIPRLNGPLGFCAAAGSVLALGITFIIPLEQLLLWSAATVATELDGHFVDYLLHTLSIASIGAGVIVAVALAIHLAKRRHAGAGFSAITRIATLGYCLPGAALATGFVQSLPSADFSAILGGGLGVLLVAYVVRFLAMGFVAVRDAFEQITPNMEKAAHSLGINGLGLWWQVRFPLLYGGLLGAFLLAFVEMLREMPIMLLLRPAGWDTLALRIFDLAAQGDWQRAALPAVVVVLAGLAPIILLIRGTGDHHA